MQRNSFQAATKRSNLTQTIDAKTQTEMLRSALTFIESNTIIRSQNEQMIDATRIWLCAHPVFDDNETQHSARHRMRRIQFKGRTT
ncbi:hypothetical protein [Burkholderia sp. S171]|uniref:hypothetical protein n=1 Tax=Burkholderia sp. S171 TaxID=1641860 RepID=UPI00131C8F79|nr:hypothetical protein [Burkholderia sp. S171]